MSTVLVSQANFESHVTPSGHPERAERIRAIEQALSDSRFDKLLRKSRCKGVDNPHLKDDSSAKRHRAARRTLGLERP